MQNHSEHNELTLLYQVTADDLPFFRHQQWRVVNYAILLYLAALAFSSLLQGFVWLAGVMIVATMAAGIHILGKLEESIEVRKQRLKKLRINFSDSFNKAWGYSEKEYYSVMLLQAVIMIAGAALSIIWLQIGLPKL